MIIREFNFKLKYESCWCQFFAKLSNIANNYESKIYVIVPDENNPKRDAKDLMSLIDIFSIIYLKERKKTSPVKYEKEINFEKILKELDKADYEQRELKLTLEINGKDEEKALTAIITGLMGNLIQEKNKE
ncbi:MAG: hypothetical protein K6357_03770 [Elusimicrobiota bacterium]